MYYDVKIDEVLEYVYLTQGIYVFLSGSINENPEQGTVVTTTVLLSTYTRVLAVTRDTTFYRVRSSIVFVCGIVRLTTALASTATFRCVGQMESPVVVRVNTTTDRTIHAHGREGEFSP